MTPQSRPATNADIEAFYGSPQANTMRAWLWELDGQILAIGGVTYQGKSKPPLIFSHITPEGRRYRKTILKGAKAAIEALVHVPTLAVADPSEPGSIRLLLHLGFEPIGPMPQGFVYLYTPKAR